MSEYGEVFDRKMAEETALTAAREVGGTIDRLYDHGDSFFENSKVRSIITKAELRKITRACRAFEVAMTPLMDEVGERYEAGKKKS